MNRASPGVSAAQVEACLQRELQPSALRVQDDSAAHAGHAGAREGSHFSVFIESPRFAEMPPLARHRLVYHALRELMPTGIHALAITARAPVES